MEMEIIFVLVLQNGPARILNVDLKGNKYTYIGELYQINEGHSLSFSEINSIKQTVT